MTEKTFVAGSVRVPAGHVMLNGQAIREPFIVVVSAGARWRPEWDQPRITVVAHRILSNGDAIGYHGQTVRNFPVPTELDALIDRHDQPVTLADTEELAKLGLTVPMEPEAHVAFHVR